MQPFGALRKCEGSGAGLGLGLLGGVFDLIGTSMTNNANQNLQYQSYLQQQKLMDKANDINVQNWRMQNEYNSPKNESKRLLDAGINPTLAKYGGTGSSSASSIPSVGAPSAPSPIPSENGLRQLGLGINQGLQNYLQIRKTESDLTSAKIRDDNDSLRALADYKKSGAESYKIGMEAEKLFDDLNFNRDSYDLRMQQIEHANNLIVAQQNEAEARTKGLQIVNDFAPELQDLQRKQFASQIAVASAECAEILSRRDLNNEEKKLKIKQIVQQDTINRNLPKKLHNDNALQVATYNEILGRASLINQQKETEKWNTIDRRKHAGAYSTSSNRPMDDLAREIMMDVGKTATKVK